MSSDLISKEGILEYLKTVTVTEGITFETGFKQILHDIETQPSTDIMECAREIKDYCEGFPNCEGCRFYKGYPFRCTFGCTFGLCPQEWKLPEGEKK